MGAKQSNPYDDPRAKNAQLIHLKVTFCGACGYADRYQRFKQTVEAKLPNVVCTGEATPKVTGAFEVVHPKTGKVYHSKLAGAGYIDNDAKKLEGLYAAITADFPTAAATA